MNVRNVQYFRSNAQINFQYSCSIILKATTCLKVEYYLWKLEIFPVKTVFVLKNKPERICGSKQVYIEHLKINILEAIPAEQDTGYQKHLNSVRELK